MSAPPDGQKQAPSRKKTMEACQQCRARKSKCDGCLPCKGCKRSNLQCVYDPSTTINKVAGEFDILSARLVELERAVFGEKTYLPKGASFLPPGGNTTLTPAPRFEAVTKLNTNTGSVEFYGSTSTFALTRFLNERLQEFEKQGDDRPPPNKRPRLLVQGSAENECELDGIFENNAFVPGTSQQARKWQLRGDVANAHIHNFFNTIHTFLPVLDPEAFWQRYHKFWASPPSESETIASQQWQCLMYAVLAMGALYANTGANNTEWAANYFAEAQDLLGKLFDAISIETVQAATIMGCYAQHVIKPNLAYNYIGVAIRLAYSIGINRAPKKSYSTPASYQNALRTWWLLYGLESELSLDSGRPMSIRETDAKAEFPEDLLDPATSLSKVTFITVMAKFGRIARKTIDMISSIHEDKSGAQSYIGRLMNYQTELMAWRDNLPSHLVFEKNEKNSPTGKWKDIVWVQRQREAVQVHFNHVMLMMHRPFCTESQVSTPFYSSSMSITVCLGAARENVLLIHRILNEDSSRGRWRYLGYYCLTATLILLMRIFESPEEAERVTLADLCSKSQIVFGLIDSDTSKRCAALVKKVLGRWQNKRQGRWGQNQTQNTDVVSQSIVDSIPDFRSEAFTIGPEPSMELSVSPSDDLFRDIFGGFNKNQPIEDFLRLYNEGVSERPVMFDGIETFETDSSLY